MLPALIKSSFKHICNY